MSQQHPIKKSNQTKKHLLLNPFMLLQNDMDKIMNNFYNLFGLPHPSAEKMNNLTINPAVNLVEDDKNFKVEFEMPGIDENDVKIFIENNVLCIQAEKKISHKNKDKSFLHQEIGYGFYEKMIPIPENVDADKATASFKKGMLWVNFEKKQEAQKKSQHKEIKVEKA